MRGIDYKVRSRESDASSLVAARKSSAHSTKNEGVELWLAEEADALGSTSLNKVWLRVDAVKGF